MSLSKHLATAAKALADAALEAGKLEETVHAVERRQHVVEEQWLLTQGELLAASKRMEQSQQDNQGQVKSALNDVAAKLGVLVQLLQSKAQPPPEPSVIVDPGLAP